METALPALETDALRKVFGSPPNEKVAVKNLTLQVEQGEVFGFLGPNGAGKTTSVKMLLGLTAPSAGSGRLFGLPLGDPQGRLKVGFLPEHFRFHDWLTAQEFLHVHGELYHMPFEVRKQRVPELLELVGLDQHQNIKLRAFSKGMLQRIGLAQALLNDPDLVILDEPTSGLDPVGRLLVRDIIRDLRSKNKTVFLNSHLLSEVEVTCDRVAFIKHGEILQTSRLHTLVEGELSVEAQVRSGSTEYLQGLAQWASNIRLDGEHLSFTLQEEADLPNIHRYLVECGVDVFALQPQKISLEDLFVKIVGTDGGL